MAQKGSTPACSEAILLACLLLALEGSMCVPPRPEARISQRDWRGGALAGMRGGGGTFRISPEDDGMPMRNGGAWATAYSDRLDSDSLSDAKSGDWGWDSEEGSDMGGRAKSGASGGGSGPPKGPRRSALLDEGAMTQVTPGMAGLRERKREADPKKRGNQTARKLVGEGVRLATSGDLSTAAERLSSAISLAPDLAEAHANLANVRLQMGEVDEVRVPCIMLDACVLCRKCHLSGHFNSRLRDLPDVGNNKAMLLVRADDSRATLQAISGYMEAKRLNPGLQETRYNLATALHGLALRARAAEVTNMCYTSSPFSLHEVCSSARNQCVWVRVGGQVLNFLGKCLVCACRQDGANSRLRGGARPRLSILRRLPCVRRRTRTST